MACYELSYEENVPFKVTINEAIDLGKKFSTGDSGRFINGILDEYAKRCRSAEKKTDAATKKKNKDKNE